MIADEEACGIISELKKLQDTDEKSRTYGCMRWCREETFIRDTSGAFFVLFPCILAYKVYSDKMADAEKKGILELLSHAVRCFNIAQNSCQLISFKQIASKPKNIL